MGERNSSARSSTVGGVEATSWHAAEVHSVGVGARVRVWVRVKGEG